MVIARLIGGLGNQMFQYAAARAIACRIRQEPGLDITAFENYRLRSYRLGCFNIVENFVGSEKVRSIRRRQIGCESGFINKLKWKFLPERRKIFTQQGYHFHADILKIRKSVYLDGYWQSEKYFSDMADIMRKDFTFRSEPDSENKQLLLKIESCPSVSLHIRRGDYVNDRDTFTIHGVLSMDYYLRSLDYIAQRVHHPHFFIFSDDMAWVRQNLKINYPHDFIDHNGAQKDYEDMRLMSHCRHHIIANSSFSWWGAWLCNHADKIVIAPARWFSAEEMKKCDQLDILPETWVVI